MAATKPTPLVDELTLVHTKDTKNTVRYDAPENALGAAVTSLYVAKHAFAALGRVPETITITVTAS